MPNVEELTNIEPGDVAMVVRAGPDGGSLRVMGFKFFEEAPHDDQTLAVLVHLIRGCMEVILNHPQDLVDVAVEAFQADAGGDWPMDGMEEGSETPPPGRLLN